MSIILLKSLLSENEVFDKYKQGWLGPNGKLIWLDGEYHTEWAAKNVLHVPWEKEKDASYVDTIMDEMYKRGWYRMILDIQGSKRFLYYDNPNDPYRVLNRSQKNTLIDYGIEHELTVVNSNNKSNPIYEPPEMEKECTNGVSLPIIRKKFWAPKSGHETPRSKELVKENPDEVWEDGDKIGQFTDKDAYTFIIDRKTGVGLYAESREIYHGTMARILAQVGKSNDIKDLKFDSELRGEVQMDYTGSESDVLKFANEIASQHPLIDGRKMGISGRYWMDEKVVSFWNTRDEVLKNWKVIEKFLEEKFRDINKLKFDFVERRHDVPLYTTKDLGVSKGTRSPEEIRDLMAKQHIDPNAKKELEKMGYISDRGSKKQHKRSSSAGYDHPAAFNFARALNESPDYVISNGKGMDMYPYSSDAVAFIIDPETKMILYGKNPDIYHGVIYLTLKSIVNNKGISNKIIKSILDNKNIKLIGSPDDVRKFSERVKSLLNISIDERQIGIEGRLWSQNNIVSFWNKKSEVLKNWNVIESYLKNIFDMNKLQIDFAEKKDSDPLYTTRDLDTNKKSKSPEEIKALMSIQHLDPNAKKELQTLGYSVDPGSMKMQQRASDAGFPHVAAHHASQPFKENKKLNETPDRVISNGEIVAGVGERDTYTFIIDDESDLAIYGLTRSNSGKFSENLYHPNIHVILKYLLMWIKNGKNIKEFLDSVTEDFHYYGSEKELIDFAERFTVKRHESGRTMGLSGRYWADKNIVSFWTKRETVVKNWNKVESFLNKLPYHRDLSDIKVDFVEKKDKDPLYTPADLGIEKGKISPEELRDLMKKQHIDPNAKKRLGRLGHISDPGSEKQKSRATSAGYDHPAAFNFARSIVESPDEVWSKDRAVASHNERDAYTFIIDRKTGAAFYASSSEEKKVDAVYHYHILDIITNVRNLKDRSVSSIKSYLKKHGISFIASDSDILTILKRSGSYEVEESKDARRIVMAGRFWKRKRIVSFWNSRKDIIKNWNITSSFLTKIFGSIEKIRFDFVEKDESEPLYTTQDLDKEKKKKSKEEIMDLMSRQHLDPKAKAELRDRGISGGGGSEKYQKRASDAGFPHPAAYDAATPFREQKFIKLKSLIPKNN